LEGVKRLGHEGNLGLRMPFGGVLKLAGMSLSSRACVMRVGILMGKASVARLIASLQSICLDRLNATASRRSPSLNFCIPIIAKSSLF
jgi:hypothetical protein